MTFKQLTSPAVRDWCHKKSEERSKTGATFSKEDLMKEFNEWFNANIDLINESAGSIEGTKTGTKYSLDDILKDYKDALTGIAGSVAEDNTGPVSKETIKALESKDYAKVWRFLKRDIEADTFGRLIPRVYADDFIEFVNDVMNHKYDSEDKKYGVIDLNVLENLKIKMEVGIEDNEPFENFKNDILRDMRKM